MALDELKGMDLGAQTVVVERGPVRVFADALGDDDPVYRGDDAPVPPTFPFVMPYWGSVGKGGAGALPIEKLRGPGRMILHGEQEFTYHRMPRVGDTLEGRTQVTDVYEKEGKGGGKMEFYVSETDWRTPDGEPVVTAKFVLIVRVTPPKS